MDDSEIVNSGTEFHGRCELRKDDDAIGRQQLLFVVSGIKIEESVRHTKLKIS